MNKAIVVFSIAMGIVGAELTLASAQSFDNGGFQCGVSPVRIEGMLPVPIPEGLTCVDAG
ncbi:hypothetical protein PPNSA23_08220 [Phyllobacterium phragmitis]|uniref:Porin n=1 Tax=Phyllobacterium phragmitis TaxID=2670329 RepID=A0ABQ0GW32_9HYPH